MNKAYDFWAKNLIATLVIPTEKSKVMLIMEGQSNDVADVFYDGFLSVGVLQGGDDKRGEKVEHEDVHRIGDGVKAI